MVKEIWQVYKFGGSSLADGQCLLTVNEIIHQNESSNLVVVVSAMAGMTDQLVDYSKSKDNSILLKIEDRYRMTLKETINEKSIIKSLEDEFRNDLNTIKELAQSFSTEKISIEENQVLGFGEIWSSRLIRGILSQASSRDLNDRDLHLINPLDVITLYHTDMGANVDWAESEKSFNKVFSGKNGIFVMAGFIAKNSDSVPTNLGRNGSDYSASIIGSLAKARSVSIWTDTDGIMTADPNHIQTAKTIQQMSYDEAIELAYFGAEVIHEKTMLPLMNKGIPIYIRNTFNPESHGTEISSKVKGVKSVKGITTIDNIILVNIEGSGMIGVPGTAKRLFSCLSDAGISVILITQASSEHSICFAIDDKYSDQIESVLKVEFRTDFQNGNLQQLQIQENCSIIAVVGSGMTGTKGIAAQFFKAITQSEVNVMAIAQGSSEKNISVVVKKDDLNQAVQSVHNAFFTGKTELVIALAGFGNVGQEFYHQVEAQKDKIFKDFNLEINFVAIANSSHMILDEDISESDIASLIAKDQSCRASKVEDIIDFLDKTPADLKVFIDCSASDLIPDFYTECFQSGINVITANKKGLSGSLSRYKDIMRSAKDNKRTFLYETTAGAALPFIKSVKDISISGDVIEEIEGVFSGTLAYLFNSFDGSEPFSKIVSTAREQGYTEPDPRDDLSGMDVARKLAILAREMGLNIEVKDVEIENLVSQNHSDLSVVDYLEEMVNDDSIMEKRYKQANHDGKVLCYLARLNADGKASVKLEALSKEHPFSRLEGTENIIKYKTRRYSKHPLVHRGPGAGPEVTAAGIFSDLLAFLNTH